MKKIFFILVIILLFLLSFFLGKFSADFFNSKSEIETTLTESESTTLTEEPSTTKASKLPDKNSVYYNADYSKLKFEAQSDNTAVNYLSYISSVTYGTAGSTHKHEQAAYYFILLSQMSEQELSDIPVCLDKLSPAQLDYLSFRLTESFHLATEIIKGERIFPMFSSQYIEPETYKNCTETQAVRFLSHMISLFDERNVKYEWEEYDIVSLLN